MLLVDIADDQRWVGKEYKVLPLGPGALSGGGANRAHNIAREGGGTILHRLVIKEMAWKSITSRNVTGPGGPSSEVEEGRGGVIGPSK